MGPGAGQILSGDQTSERKGNKIGNKKRDRKYGMAFNLDVLGYQVSILLGFMIKVYLMPI